MRVSSRMRPAVRTRAVNRNEQNQDGEIVIQEEPSPDGSEGVRRDGVTASGTAPSGVDLSALSSVLQQLEQTLRAVVEVTTGSSEAVSRTSVPEASATAGEDPRPASQAAAGEGESAAAVPALRSSQVRKRHSRRPASRSGRGDYRERGRGRAEERRHTRSRRGGSKGLQTRDQRGRRAIPRGGGSPSDPSDDESIWESVSSEDSDSETEPSLLSEGGDADGSDDSSVEEGERGRSHGYLRRQRGGGGQHSRPTPGQLDRNFKNLNLRPYVPSPNTSVANWVDNVDMVIREAEETGRGGWTDRELYTKLGQLLGESAFDWRVSIDRQLVHGRRTDLMTWTYLKKLLLQRFGVRRKRADVELLVTQRGKFGTETYMDYAAQLRQIVGRTRVRERVLLDQFYRQLRTSVSTLVQDRRPRPKTIEDAARIASRIDTREARRIARAVATKLGHAVAAPQAKVGSEPVVAGSVPVIPGVSYRQAEAIQRRVEETLSDEEELEKRELPIVTNPAGVYNPANDVWEAPANCEYAGGAWVPKRRVQPARNSWTPVEGGKRHREDGPTFRRGKRAKVSKVVEAQGHSDLQSSTASENDVEGRPAPVMAAYGKPINQQQPNDCATQPSAAFIQQVVQRTLAQQAETMGKRGGCSVMRCYNCNGEGHYASSCPRGPKCYACHDFGHLARECPNDDKKAGNDGSQRAREERVDGGDGTTSSRYKQPGMKGNADRA